MKGINTIQYIEIMNFVQMYQPFIDIFTKDDEQEIKKQFPNYIYLGIKYVNTVHDTRTNSIYYISFRRGGMKYEFCTSNLPSNPNSIYNNYDNLFDMVMDFLKGNITDVKEIYMIEK